MSEDHVTLMLPVMAGLLCYYDFLAFSFSLFFLCLFILPTILVTARLLFLHVTINVEYDGLCDV